MKKAKFALTAVAVLAVVGGALAFKASRGNQIQVYTESAGKCNVTTTLFDRTLNGVGQTFTTKFSIAPTLTPCPVQTVYSLQ